MGDQKKWWQSKTVWAALMSIVATILGVTGHNISVDDQSNVVNDLTNIADGVSGLFALLAAYYRTQATKTIAPVLPKGA